MFYFLKVQTNSEYKFIREDRWLTPVRAPNLEDAKVFSTPEDALEYARKFNLVSTGHTIEVCDFSDKKFYLCTLKNDGKGKFVLDAQKVK